MKEALDALITIYKARLATLEIGVAEVHERMGDDFNVSDWCGGNFDDAYSLGDQHGALFNEYSLLHSVVHELRNIREEGSK